MSWRFVGVFLLTFGLLQAGWGTLAEAAPGQWVIHDATVRVAAASINVLTPEIQAQALGSRIAAVGGGINVLNGCEGTEVWFLMLAALVAHAFSWRARLVGALLGTVWVYGLNQLRLLVLFYSHRQNPSLFEQLHGLVAPLVLILATIGFVLVLMQWDRSRAV